VIVHYLAGMLIRRELVAGAERAAHRLMIAGVLANLALLGFFKYYNFFMDGLNALLRSDFGFVHLVLPLAISFFTLTQIAYLVDVRHRRAQEPSFLHYALFVTYFPHLIAGPILHHSEILPQFRRQAPFRFDPNAFSVGASIFLLGLFKKVSLADPIARYADPVFLAAAGGAEPSFYAAWIGTLCFGFQIYFDFSAYSDMAIGLARMMSIDLPLNFDSPYRAASIIDFWRRWHMTLSRFLRDYVYIPLGGNRHGKARRHINILATMLIGGLWHGAAWTFVAWGGLHGIFLVSNHVWRDLRGHSRWLGWRAGKVLGIALTFVAVNFAWIFFRAENFGAARRIIEGMLGMHGAELPAQVISLFPPLRYVATPGGYIELLAHGTLLGFVEITAMLAICFVIVFGAPNLYRLSQRQRLLLVVLTAGFVLQHLLFGQAASQFIYFRF
jgi:D-alanyl-lipoteichoic acid acyltransferase DltB (MBOAT superfamily)